MLFIGLNIRNPWSRRWSAIRTRAFSVTKNKSIELGLYKTNSIIGVGFNIDSFYYDHAGFSFDVSVFGYEFDFQFYDNRHFDEQTN